MRDVVCRWGAVNDGLLHDDTEYIRTVAVDCYDSMVNRAYLEQLSHVIFVIIVLAAVVLSASSLLPVGVVCCMCVCSCCVNSETILGRSCRLIQLWFLSLRRAVLKGPEMGVIFEEQNRHHEMFPHGTPTQEQ